MFTPKQVYHLDWEERIPQDHLLRRVAEAVDFAFVRRLTARFYSHTGQPGIDPVVLVKMALLGYLYGITSERRLAEELRLNLAFTWFVGDDLDERTPDHSVLSKARRRFGVTVYQAFFAEIVRQCRQAGLVAGDQVFADSTLVEANADRAALGSRALLAQVSGPDDYVAAVWRDNPPAVASGPLAAEPTVASGAAMGPHPLGPDDQPNVVAGPVNTLVASRTDPDAGLVSRPGVALGLYHKVHVAVDGGQARLITAIDVTPGDLADADLLDRLCKEHEGTPRWTLREVVADAKYGTHVTYRALDGRGILPSIPPPDTRWDARAIPSACFAYDPVADCYRCPEGQPLTRQGFSRGARAGGGIIYRASPKACGACTRKAECCGDAKARTICRPADDDGLPERVRAHLQTPHARRSIRRRKYWAETAVAELKERHGLRRASLRGRTKVLMQAFLAAMAYNVKKLAGAHRPCGQATAVALHLYPRRQLLPKRRAAPGVAHCPRA